MLEGEAHETHEVPKVKALVVILLTLIMVLGVVGAASASEPGVPTQAYFSAAPVQPEPVPEAPPTGLQVAVIVGMGLLLSALLVWVLWSVYHRGVGVPPSSWGLHRFRVYDSSTNHRRSVTPNKGSVTSVSASRGA